VEVGGSGAVFGSVFGSVCAIGFVGNLVAIAPAVTTNVVAVTVADVASRT